MDPESGQVHVVDQVTVSRLGQRGYEFTKAPMPVKVSCSSRLADTLLFSALLLGLVTVADPGQEKPVLKMHLAQKV